MQSLKTLHVIGSMNPVTGGPCQGLRNSIPDLISFGFNNEVATFDDPSVATSWTDHFPVHYMGPANNPWRYSAKMGSWLNENIARFNIVLIHGLWLYHSQATFRAVVRQRRITSSLVPKVFLMSHGMLDPWFQKTPTRRLKAWRNCIYWELFEKRVVNGVDGILFTAEQELLLARQSFRGYRPQRELNVGYGVIEPPAQNTAMDEARLRICPRSNRFPYLLYISRIHPKKGVDLLLKAYSKLIQEHKPSDRRIPDLMIAGPNDSPYAKSMIQLATDLNLYVASDDTNVNQPSVYFTGLLLGDAKWGAFYGCEAFILPSHQENFGIAVAEALACGKPVLISNQVNIWREIESEHGGLVEPDTVEGTYRLLKQWVELDDTRRSEMARDARACYEKHFDTSASTYRMAEALRGSTESIVEGKH